MGCHGLLSSNEQTFSLNSAFTKPFSAEEAVEKTASQPGFSSVPVFTTLFADSHAT